MTTAALIDKKTEADDAIVALVERELRLVYETLNLTDIEATREALIEAGEALVRTYGPAAALIAAQFYDDIRDASPNATGRYRATMAPESPVREKVESSVRWAVAPLVGPLFDKEAAFGRTVGALSTQVLGYGRDTIAYNTARDPARPRWTRVPRGSNPCDFCLNLARQGAVYESDQSDANRYHDHCYCVPVAIYAGDAYPEGYDLDALDKEYEARQAAKTT